MFDLTIKLSIRIVFTLFIFNFYSFVVYPISLVFFQIVDFVVKVKKRRFLVTVFLKLVFLALVLSTELTVILILILNITISLINVFIIINRSLLDLCLDTFIPLQIDGLSFINKIVALVPEL